MSNIVKKKKKRENTLRRVVEAPHTLGALTLLWMPATKVSEAVP